MKWILDLKVGLRTWDFYCVYIDESEVFQKLTARRAHVFFFLISLTTAHFWATLFTQSITE